MSNIVNDIVDEIDVKPNKWKLIVKWVVGISGSLIIAAFAFGQFKASFFNRLDKLEAKIDTHTEKIEDLEKVQRRRANQERRQKQDGQLQRRTQRLSGTVR